MLQPCGEDVRVTRSGGASLPPSLKTYIEDEDADREEEDRSGDDVGDTDSDAEQLKTGGLREELKEEWRGEERMVGISVACGEKPEKEKKKRKCAEIKPLRSFHRTKPMTQHLPGRSSGLGNNKNS